jgi:hypothetical protein
MPWCARPLVVPARSAGSDSILRPNPRLRRPRPERAAVAEAASRWRDVRAPGRQYQCSGSIYECSSVVSDLLVLGHLTCMTAVASTASGSALWLENLSPRPPGPPQKDR